MSASSKKNSLGSLYNVSFLLVILRRTCVAKGGGGGLGGGCVCGAGPQLSILLLSILMHSVMAASMALALQSFFARLFTFRVLAAAATGVDVVLFLLLDLTPGALVLGTKVETFNLKKTQ